MDKIDLTVYLPKVWVVIGDKREQGYPVFYCAAGNNSGSIVLGYVRPDPPEAYEIACAMAEAYNNQRNAGE